VASMNLLMTDRAVSKAGRSQIVERWGHNSQSGVRFRRHRQVGVAFKTHQPYYLPGQHTWIGRAMRLVASATTLKPHGRVLERKWTALVAVAVEASRFIGTERLHHCRLDTAMRIVAIDAGHGALRQFMMIRQLKLRPDIHMAAGALFIDGGRLADHKVMASVRVNLVARCAGNLVLHVTALEAPHLRWLVQVTTEADLVSRGSVEFAGIPYVLDREGLGVFLSRAVARLAGPSIESVPLIAFDSMVRAF
jgi:hypothetical protein